MAQNSSAANTTYVSLPSLVVNYGGSGRLRYLKAELSLRVSDKGYADAVRYHMPLIRNTLVLLFSHQQESDVQSAEGKEQLRQLALAEIDRLLSAEEGRSGVTDLLFNNLIVQ